MHFLNKLLAFFLIHCVKNGIARKFENTKNKVDCPSDWINEEDLGCFYFAEKAGHMSWLKAKTYCENLGAHLAEVPDELTQVLLRDIANTLPDHSWWLGATDSETEGIWRWDRTGMTLDYSAWGEGEPDNLGGAGHPEEDCLILRRASKDSERSWNDIGCEDTSSYPISLWFDIRPLCQKL